MLLEMFSMGSPLPKVELQPPELKQLLTYYEDIFQEPRGLPPS